MQDGINPPGGGVRVAILRRDVPHRHLVVSGGAGRIVEGLHCISSEINPKFTELRELLIPTR